MSLSDRILIILLICAAGITWTIWLIYSWSGKGVLIPSSNASDAPGTALLQAVIFDAVPLILFIVLIAVLRKRFAEEMYLRITGKKQWIITAVLAAGLLGMTAAALCVKQDKVLVIYSLLYYTLFIAAAEEFTVRGFCVWLLKDERAILRYLLPNILFAALHFFAYANWGEITAGYALHFFSSQFWGLVAIGCVFQLLKEKTGTLWVPILLHAIWDFSSVFLY